MKDEPSKAHRLAQIICLYRHSMKYEEMVDLINVELHKLHDETVDRLVNIAWCWDRNDAYPNDLAAAIRGALHKTKVL